MKIMIILYINLPCIYIYIYIYYFSLTSKIRKPTRKTDELSNYLKYATFAFVVSLNLVTIIFIIEKKILT